MSEPAIQAPPRVPHVGHGGKRKNAGRRKTPPAPVSLERAIDVSMPDVARHVDPKTAAPVWTADLEDRFVQAYYEHRGSLRLACIQLGIAYQAARTWERKSETFAAKLALAYDLFREAVRDEHLDRVMTDRHRPASMLFELRARDPLYKPVTSHGTPVRVQIAFTDGAFAAPKSVPAVIDVPALTEGSDDAEAGE